MSAPDLPSHLQAFADSRAALARAITCVENDRADAPAVWRQARARCGRAQIVGITGAPGAGKSTLIAALLRELLARGKELAVLAVDPSSPITGGALLGDRVRMGDIDSERVFIRSVSARGHLGGLSRTAGRVIDLFDAAGFDIVIVETVGAGQSEVEIAQYADVRVVLCPPGLGDEVQAIKAGILEIADLLVVNKADSPLAERSLRDLRAHFAHRQQGEWPVRILPTVATTGEGVAELADLLELHARSIGVGRRLPQLPGLRREAPGGDQRAAVLLIVGATRLAHVLAPMAALAGFEVHLVEPRRAGREADVAGVHRSADLARSFAALNRQRPAAVVVLTRDRALTAQAVHAARAQGAFYVGVPSRQSAAAMPHPASELEAAVEAAPEASSLGERAVLLLARIIAARHR